MKCYAVIDTNVFLSALISKKDGIEVFPQATGEVLIDMDD